MSVKSHIIIVSYKSNMDLAHCLPAVCATVGDTPVTVVDNAAPDPELHWVKTTYPQWQIILNEANLGFGQANNLAAQTSTAKYLIFLNPDTLPQAGWLDALEEALEKADTSIGLATARIVLLDHMERMNTAGNIVHFSGLAYCRGLNESVANYRNRMLVPAVSGACFIIRRSLFEALEGFDPLYFMYLEDTDLSLRALLRGYSTLYVPDAVVAHDYKFRLNNSKVFYQERNRYLMVLKLLKWPTLFSMLPILVLTEIMIWGFVILKSWGAIGEKMQAYRWLWQNRETIMLRRQTMQQQRVISDRSLLKSLNARIELNAYSRSLLTAVPQAIFNGLYSVYYFILLCFIRW
ncbi:MAG: glycosyltransferase family 2 protein [Anaerolineae bacterium]|nr:glycosyltransferase family 2 protein [Anaerolineae bacterium]